MMRILRFSYLFLICVCACQMSCAMKTRNVFYVLGSDGIYLINPEEGRLEGKITNTSAPGLCTKSNNRVSRNSCSFTEAYVVNDDALYVADRPGNAVKVIDVNNLRIIETIPTDPAPYGLYYLPWREEVWVHSWSNATFDVIDTESRARTHTAVRAHTKPGFTHGVLLAKKDLDANTGYVSHMWNAGVHKINLNSKSYSGYLNLTAQGCSGTYGMAYSASSYKLFVQCLKNNKPDYFLTIALPSEKVELSVSWPGRPFASPDGRFLVILYAPVNETNNALLDSVMRVVLLANNPFVLTNELRIPGGVSRVHFHPKSSGSYNAFVTLKFASKIAVVDLDAVSERGLGAVSYIENVGELDTTKHSASRSIYAKGKWILSPASKSNSVVIVDADTRKVHKTVENVNGGTFVVWVDGTSNGGGGLGATCKMVFIALVAVRVLGNHV